MKEYRKVDSLFSGLDAHAVQSRSLIEKAYFDEDSNLISAQILFTLDDGMQLELCLWSNYSEFGDLSIWDVSVAKSAFPGDGKAYVQYLAGKGLYLEDVDDGTDRWHYAGLLPKDDVWRIQYYAREPLS